MLKILSILSIIVVATYAQQDSIIQQDTLTQNQDSVIQQDTTPQPDTPKQQLVNLYPDSTLLKKCNHPTIYKVSSAKKAGVLIILTGIASTVLTIVDANITEVNYVDVPYTYKNNRQTVTGTRKEEVRTKHKWTPSHTIYSVLSGGLILTGIITINL